jgi:hypothetical protein
MKQVMATHISHWFSPQRLISHFSLVNVEMKTQHTNNILKPCASAMNGNV